MDDVRITWLGHSCFVIAKDDYRIVFDPYEDGYVPGLNSLRVDADKVICSHGHGDHTAPANVVSIRSDAATKACPWETMEIVSFHDKEEGALRGSNTITILSDDNYKIAHMGDIGCRPTDEQMAELAGLDVMLVPVGGYYTLEPEEVKELVDELKPCITVPMHYRSEEYGFGFDTIAELSRYTSLCDDVVYHEGDTLYLPADLTRQTAVMFGGITCWKH